MYKPLQTVNWYYMEAYKVTPQSTTQEMLETVRVKQRKYQRSAKKFNYQILISEGHKIESPKELPLTTSYERNYAAPYDYICSSKPLQDNEPDYLWNRKPLNDFAVERLTSSEFKFMDDHLINLTPERRKVHYFRQLRNQHYPLV